MALPDPQIREALQVSGAYLEKRRPPPHIRPQLDYRIDINNSDVMLVSVRPAPFEEGRMLDLPIAKVKWVNTRQRWRLFWMRADGKWHSYEPRNETRTLAEAFEEIDRDPHCCFFG